VLDSINAWLDAFRLDSSGRPDPFNRADYQQQQQQQQQLQQQEQHLRVARWQRFEFVWVSSSTIGIFSTRLYNSALFFVVAVAVVVAVVVAVAVADPIRMVLGLIAVNYGAVASMASPLAQHQQQENGQEMTQLNGKEKKWPWN